MPEGQVILVTGSSRGIGATLVNNAGLNIDGPFLTMTDTQWDRVIATNLMGTFICSQEFAFHFTGDVGHIVKEIPVGRLGITEDVFRVVRFIIEDSDYITGQNFFVNGGNFMY